MKKNIAIVAVILFALIGAAAPFLWKNFSGAGPAFFDPPEDITELIPPPEQYEPPMVPSPTLPTPVQSTGMPLKLPPGFSISIFAKGLKAPRVMQLTPGGEMLVSIPSQGRIVALVDADKNGVAEKTVTVLEGLNRPHGIVVSCDLPQAPNCYLYVAESHRVSMYDYDEHKLTATNQRKIADTPDGGGHFTRSLLLTQDKLLISIGSSCNVCNEGDPRRASIQYIGIDETLKTFARGLRNAVFMAVHPVTKKVWVTEMGRDLIGDDIPPDEINIVEEGKNYGWPICYGKNVHDTDFDKNTYIRNPCMEPLETQSHVDLQAHSAPLGLAFFPATWPEEYRYDLLVAYHGSWNRTKPTGYSVVRLKLDENGNYLGQEDFITGWLTEEGALGRPVDIMIENDRTIYISDDKAGVIYRVIRN